MQQPEQTKTYENYINDNTTNRIYYGTHSRAQKEKHVRSLQIFTANGTDVKDVEVDSFTHEHAHTLLTH